ncbi:MAG: peptidase and in, kexin, sedolisin [Acidimicrobiaceae bacterium]|nr:peptidase and in, kexin, sedolisin [Acidimicrobiaceae bacterium]
MVDHRIPEAHASSWVARRRLAATVSVLVAGSFVGTATFSGASDAAGVKARPTNAARYIVQARSTGAARADVRAAGGRVRSDLAIVRGAVAELTPRERAVLAAEPGVAVSSDPSVGIEDLDFGSGASGADASPSGGDVATPSITSTSPSHGPSAAFPEVTGADRLWASGVTGTGVTVAVLDTGIDAALPDLAGRVIDGVDLSGERNAYQDSYGHGTFVAGLIASDGASSGGAYMGEAPGASLVSIKVAGASGVTSEGTVIAGIQWAIAHESADRIRVLNISLGVKPTGPTATDPLDQAVEQAWNAGIVVVTSAGNSGPTNGTITSPGNDPLAITVGALDDGGAANPTGYSVPSFSSAGPTMFDGWFKPDVVAPGRSVVSLAAPSSTVYDANPSAVVGQANFVGTGTSFSAAIVAGEAAVALQSHPGLVPDAVKSRLLFTADPAPTSSPFAAGHGIADAYAATNARRVPQLDQAVAAAAESSSPQASVSLSSTWSVSTWNPALWNGADWNGADWNGDSWT